MLNYFSAIAIGIATGYGLCFPVNAFTNEAALNRCETQTETHRIVSLDTIAGPSYSCIKKEFWFSQKHKPLAIASGIFQL